MPGLVRELAGYALKEPVWVEMAELRATAGQPQADPIPCVVNPAGLAALADACDASPEIRAALDGVVAFETAKRKEGEGYLVVLSSEALMNAWVKGQQALKEADWTPEMRLRFRTKMAEFTENRFSQYGPLLDLLMDCPAVTLDRWQLVYIALVLSVAPAMLESLQAPPVGI